MRDSLKLRFVVLMLALLAFGCESNNKGKIEGKWSSQAATLKGKSAPAGLLTLEFTPDGRVTYVAGPQTFTGKYSLGMGDRVTLNMDQNLGDRKTHVQTIKIAGNVLTMIDSDGTSLSFDKVGGGGTAPPKKN